MLRQPQLHNRGSRVSVGTWLLPKPPRQTHTHARTHARARADQSHTPAVAMGARGVSIRVWHAPSQVARENDDSWQHAVWHHHQKLAPPPTPPAAFCLIPSVLLFTSSHLHRSTSPVHAHSGPIIAPAPAPVWMAPQQNHNVGCSPPPPVLCVFYSASLCASLNFTYFIHFSILLFWMVPSCVLSQPHCIVGKTFTLIKLCCFFLLLCFVSFSFQALCFLRRSHVTFFVIYMEKWFRLRLIDNWSTETCFFFV